METKTKSPAATSVDKNEVLVKFHAALVPILQAVESALAAAGFTQESNAPKYVLPTPAEIATIAATLWPQYRSDEAAVNAAIDLCLRAHLTCQECVPLTLHQMISRSHKLELTMSHLHELTRRKKLRLYPDGANVDQETRVEFFDGDLDPVRQYLNNKAAYFGWKTTKKVKCSVKLYFFDAAQRHNRQHHEEICALEAFHQRTASESDKTIEELRIGMGIPNRQRRRNGSEDYRDFMKRTEVRDDSAQSDGDLGNGWKMVQHDEQMLYWEIGEDFLDELIAWRLSMKKIKGGVRGLEMKMQSSASGASESED